MKKATTLILFCIFFQVLKAQQFSIGIEYLAQRTSLIFDQLYSYQLEEKKYSFNNAFLKNGNLSPYISFSFRNRSRLSVSFNNQMHPTMRMNSNFKLTGTTNSYTNFEQRQVRMLYQTPLVAIKSLNILGIIGIGYATTNKQERIDKINSSKEGLANNPYDSYELSTDNNKVRNLINLDFSESHLLDIENYLTLHAGLGFEFKNFYINLMYGRAPYKISPGSIFKSLSIYSIRYGYDFNLKPITKMIKANENMNFKNLFNTNSSLTTVYLKFGIPLFSFIQLKGQGLHSNSSGAFDQSEFDNDFGHYDFYGSKKYNLVKFNSLDRVENSMAFHLGVKKYFKNKFSIEGEFGFSKLNMSLSGNVNTIDVLDGENNINENVNIVPFLTYASTSRKTIAISLNYRPVITSYVSPQLKFGLGLDIYSQFQGVEFPGPNKINPFVNFGIGLNQADFCLEFQYIMGLSPISSQGGFEYLSAMNRAQINLIIPVYKFSKR